MISDKGASSGYPSRANKHIDYFKENAALVHTGLRVIGKPNVRGSHFFGGGNAKEPQAVF